jgi:1-acylglycerol-3-phosphate O-acyltransferase
MCRVTEIEHRSLSQNNARLPHEGSIIAASSLSPIDSLYLGAIFDPLFAMCYPNTRLVEPVSLLQAILRAFLNPRTQPAEGATLVDLETYVKQNQNRVIAIFPECTPSNGRAVLPLSPCLLSAPPRTKVFPLNLRYTPSDITTPVPHSYITFLWNLCSKPMHNMRIRIAEPVYNTSKRGHSSAAKTSSADILGSDGAISDSSTLIGSEDSEGPNTREERAFLDRIAEALARLGRVKRVGLGVKEKQDFLTMWTKSKRR